MVLTLKDNRNEINEFAYEKDKENEQKETEKFDCDSENDDFNNDKYKHKNENKFNKISEINNNENNSNIPKIGIKFMTTSLANARAMLFRYRLIEFVLKEHQKFLETNFFVYFNPLYKGSWHSHFKLESINDPPAIDLPTKDSYHLSFKIDQSNLERIENVKQKLNSGDLSYRRKEEETFETPFKNNSNNNNNNNAANNNNNNKCYNVLKIGKHDMLKSIDDTKSPSPEIRGTTPKHMSHLDRDLLKKIRKREKITQFKQNHGLCHQF